MRIAGDNPFSLLEEKHMRSILAFLAENESTTKTEIYSLISRGSRMPDKLDALERTGLIKTDRRGTANRGINTLTDKGQRVGDLVLGLRAELSPESETL